MRTAAIERRLRPWHDELAAADHDLTSALAAALAIQRDARLRAAVAARYPAGTTALALTPLGPSVLIDDGRIAGTAMGVDDSASLALDDALELAPGLANAFGETLRATTAEASRALSAFTDRADDLSFDGFAKLWRWAPLVAAQAFRYSVAIQSVFDLERDQLVDTTDPDDLRRYWDRVHALGHLTLLATAAEPAGWLAGLAHAFTWRVWTPSFPLVRERILRLAVRGGWAATRFGPAVVAPYFARLAAGQPLHAFDATLALTALAVAYPAERAAISTRLFEALDARRDELPAVFDALASSARLAIESPVEAQHAVLSRAPRADRSASLARRLAAAVDTDDDCATPTDDGWFPAIVAMAGLATAPVAAFFPDRDGDRPPRFRASRARTTLARTGVSGRSVN